MGHGIVKFFVEIFFSFTWILFRHKAKSRELEQNLRAVRWTICVTHVIVAIGLVVYGLSHLIAAIAGFVGVSLSLVVLIIQYRKLACALREELVRSVMES
jgi:hypothetical protein